MKKRFETVVRGAVNRVLNEKYSDLIFMELAVVAEVGCSGDSEHFEEMAPHFEGYSSRSDCQKATQQITAALFAELAKEPVTLVKTMRIVMALDSLGSNLKKLPNTSKVKFCRKLLYTYSEPYSEILKLLSLLDKN